MRTLASPWRAYGVREIDRGLGPPQAPLTTDAVVGLWELQWEVSQRLATESVPERVLLSAREEHRRQWANYERARPRLMATAGSMADTFAPADDPEQHARQMVNGYITALGEVLGIARPIFQRAEERGHRSR